MNGWKPHCVGHPPLSSELITACSRQNTDNVDFCIMSLEIEEHRLPGHTKATRIHTSLDVLLSWTRTQSSSNEYRRDPRTGKSTNTNESWLGHSDTFKIQIFVTVTWYRALTVHQAPSMSFENII